MLFASIHGPSVGIRDRNPRGKLLRELASASRPDAREAPPRAAGEPSRSQPFAGRRRWMSDRKTRSYHLGDKFFGGRPHLGEAGAARRLGRRHDRPFDDRRIAQDDLRRAAPPATARSPFRCWFRRRRDRPGWRRRAATRPRRSPRRICCTSVPRPPSGLPPQCATFTSSPTICRTISAVPRATSGECETMTRDTFSVTCVHPEKTKGFRR